MRLEALILLFGLGAILTLEWTLWSPRPPRVQVPNAPQALGPPPAAEGELLARLQSQGAQGHYSPIVERPLFRPDRRPEPPPDPQASSSLPEEGAPLETLDLQAVLITPETTLALVQDPAQPRPRRLRIGDEIQGWIVTAIKEDRILLERQGQQDALILRDYAKAPAAPPPSPPRPVPPRNLPRAPVRPVPRPP